MFGAIGAALGGLAASVGNYFSQQETNRTNVDNIQQSNEIPTSDG